MTVTKKSAKKSAKKTVQKNDAQATNSMGILESIRAELALEFSAKEEKILQELKNRDAKIFELTSQMNELKTNIKQIESEKSSLVIKMNDVISERDNKVNEIVNTRTQRMKDKLDKDFDAKLLERLKTVTKDLLPMQDSAASKLYNDIAAITHNSSTSPYVIMYVLDMLKHTLVMQERTRIGIDSVPHEVPPQHGG